MGAFVDLPLTAGRQVTFMWAGNSCHYDAALEFLYVVLLVTQTATRSGLRSLLSRAPGVAHGAACKIGVAVFWAMAAVACEDGSGMKAAREAVRELLDPTMARKPGDMQCALEDVEHDGMVVSVGDARQQVRVTAWLSGVLRRSGGAHFQLLRRAGVDPPWALVDGNKRNDRVLPCSAGDMQHLVSHAKCCMSPAEQGKTRSLRLFPSTSAHGGSTPARRSS
eukprot:jgi/Mesvir1/15707/Mv03288-RA.1